MAAAADRLAATVLEQVAGELHDCFARGNKLLACGNGGSASDAEHLVAELVGRYKDDRQALPALALSAGGTATLTAVANDYGYETIFARQVEALARPGDLSVRDQHQRQFTERDRSSHCGAGPRLPHRRVHRRTGWPTGVRSRDVLISAPSSTTARIQEVHGRLHPRDLRVARSPARRGKEVSGDSASPLPQRTLPELVGALRAAKSGSSAT